MTEVDTNKYWRNVHSEVHDDLAAVCYPGLPKSFNRFLDRIYLRAIEKALNGIKSNFAIEIGCGRGRWIKRLRKKGFRIWGLDISESARPQVIGSADTIPFRKNSLDFIMAITVLQHLPDKKKIESLHESNRILRIGGKLLLCELLDRVGMKWQSHVIPQNIKWWREKFNDCGFEIEEEIPVEHLPLLKIIERIQSRRRRINSEDVNRGVRVLHTFFLKKAFWELITFFSILIEPVARTIFPNSGSHRIFILKKR
ncbi:TPA: hypothetical protein DEF17_02320 [bacterium]|nr:MAG: hypothetical protein AUJ18_05955 [Candidatus Hydrogenedentes bacterium CG1_02_42_14]PIU46654.1 MAG: hypothetical protein COS94_09510 [Candidatus Hydrogenedentes bacterium CG07_land_8_20_14_0_80_42_17]HBW46752.1 hypothetical protein [bacterium]